MGLEPEGLKPTPLWRSCRLTLTFVSFLGFVLMYALRVNLSVAMVCMVNQTFVAQLAKDGQTSIRDNSTASTRTSLEESCPGDVTKKGTIKGDVEGEFAWPKEIQGLILGSFFWGYITTQVIGGWMSSRFGGKRVMGYSMFLCALSTILVPVGARIDYRLLIALRILAGISQGTVWPAMHTVWSTWAPPHESGTLLGFTFAGAQVGNVVTFPLAGLLCKYGFDGGWPSIFYVLGGSGVLWFIAWMILVYESPVTHPRISVAEREYIKTSLQERSKALHDPHDKIPWKNILTSTRVWAIAVSHTCANWGTYTFLTNIPTYMREVLRFDIQTNGFLSSLPYIGFTMLTIISGSVFDMLQRRQLLNTTMARKVGNSTGMFGQAIFLVILAYIDCNSAVWGVIILIMAVSFAGFQYGSGYLINPKDIAPQFSGIIFGISNTFSTIPGFLAPIVASLLTTHQTQQEWQKVFFISVGIYTFGASFYIIFASGAVQSWARKDSKVNPSSILEMVIESKLAKNRQRLTVNGEETKDGQLLTVTGDETKDGTLLTKTIEEAEDTKLLYDNNEEAKM